MYNSHTNILSVNILIGNSFKNYYHLPIKHLECYERRIKYICYYSNLTYIKYDAVIYNGNRQFPKTPKYSINIIMTTEKLSQVKFMKDIGNGKSSNYQLAIDYRLFNNKNHISYPIFSDYRIDEFIHLSNKNYENISNFVKRKNIVYIQKVAYRNRRYLVREIMKNLRVDSYGNDLNNIEWPKNIPRSNKIDVLKQYKFCIAIENSVITWKNRTKFEAPSINDDYVTEKLADCLLAGSIPIYFGPKNINQFLPHTDAIINMNNFNNIEELSLYIKKLLTNVKLLEKHVIWHKDISSEWIQRFSVTYNFTYCKVCNYVYLHKRK